MDTSIKVSIVIVTWNGRHFLGPCLDSLQALDYPKDQFEIIVVDNNSSDDTILFLQQHYPFVRIINNEKNYYFAKASNVGIREARGHFIALLNNDTVVDKSWLSELTENMKDGQRIGGVVPKTLFLHNPSRINSAGVIFQRRGAWPLIERGYNEEDVGQYNKLELVQGFSGVSVLLSRDMLKDVGLFDESFGMYFEDSDLSLRAHRRGWSFWYNPRALVYHVHSGTSKEGSPMFKFFVRRNHLLFVTKNCGPILIFLGWSLFLKTFALDCVRYCKWLFSFPKHGPAHTDVRTNCKVLVSYLIHTPRIIVERLGIVRKPRYQIFK